MSSAAPSPRTVLRPGAVITQPAWPEGEVRSVHVVRIGGAGMSAVARLALEAGLTVSGSDSQDGQFIAPLRAAGARIGIGFDADLVAEDCDLLIVSTAVRADNPEVVAAHERGIPVIHRAAGLAGLLVGRTLVAVAGTHGKTSTTGLAVSALRGAGHDPAWALGAAVPDLGRNAGFAADPAAGVTVVDDYAHHPREVAATLAAAQGIVEGQGRGGRVLAVFQPHLYSRTSAFAADFAAALGAADVAWVLPVYGAREDPVPGVDASTITRHAGTGALQALTEREEAAAVAGTAREGDLVLMLGAGDVVELTPGVLAALEDRGRGA